MKVTVSWDNSEKTTLRYDFGSRWTWEDFRTATADAFAMTRSVGHNVDTISNFAPDAALPANALYHFRWAMVNAPQNRGVWVVVTTSNLIKSTVATFTQFDQQLGERLLVADTLDEARAMLTQRRNQPPPASS